MKKLLATVALTLAASTAMADITVRTVMDANIVDSVKKDQSDSWYIDQTDAYKVSWEEFKQSKLDMGFSGGCWEYGNTLSCVDKKPTNNPDVTLDIHMWFINVGK